MSPLSLRCIKAAFCCLLAGVALGACFAVDRALGARLRPLHAELNLWGGVTLLIYGMAYHMLPRFAGRALRHPRLAAAQSWLAIAGVALAAVGWAAWIGGVAAGGVAMALGGGAQTTAALLFSVLVGQLLWPDSRARR